MAGRPRDPELDVGILQATRELLVEVGYQGLTLQGVARRAGVFVPAIYRRWGSKSELVEAAAFPVDVEPTERTGNLRDDLRVQVQSVLRRFADPATRAAIPGLISEQHDNPIARARIEARAAPLHENLGAMLTTAIERGELRPPPLRNPAMLLSTVLVGAALSLEVTAATPIDGELVDELTDFLLRGLSPPSEAPKSTEGPLVSPPHFYE